MKIFRFAYFLAVFSLLAVSVALFATDTMAQGTPKKAEIILQVPIPATYDLASQTEDFAQGKVKDLAGYLGVMYNFLISIVGVITAVMMMVGGFQYLTAGGDKSKVDAGKERIKNALVGMVLALSSFLILNTINPDLLVFKVPEIGGVRKVTLDVSSIVGGDLGTLCNTNAECRKPFTCVEVHDSPLNTAIQVFVTTATVAVTAPITGVSVSVGAVARGAKTALIWAGRFWWKHKIVGTAAIAGGVKAWEEVSEGYKGICATAARDLPDNSICNTNDNCASKKCLIDKGMSFTFGEIGICASGSKGSYCQCEDSDCKKSNCFAGMKCTSVGPAIGNTPLRACSDGSQATYCDEENPCKKEFVCKEVGGVGRCGLQEEVGLGAPCKSDVDCQKHLEHTRDVGVNSLNCRSFQGLCGSNRTDCICMPTNAGLVPSGKKCFKSEDCYDRSSFPACVVGSDRVGVCR
jgi:hypothetical protein